MDEALLTTVLGSSTARLIARLGALAQARGIEAYMVGGGVRDLLLRRRNLDIDFVVEGDAIVFSNAVHTALGGNVSSFRPFGTAKWMPDENTHERLGLQTNDLPEHIDFASARNEFYEHPTALPTVYSGSIKLDLQRRDFTINTLAIQVSPHFGRIIDYYGGLHDLEARQIRVLHSLSFIDDPTRILRAVRFEQRLGFTIEPRTEALMVPALPMLGRITGGRVRNELELLMKEAAPEMGLLSLAARGVLAAIHPALRMDEAMAEQFRILRDNSLDSALPLPDAYWHLLATTMTAVEAESFCERLLFSRGLHVTMVQTARLNSESKMLGAPDWRPSQIVTLLDAYAEIALRTHLLTTHNETVRDRLSTYLDTWRHMKPVITGHDLKTFGIPPGPCYKRLLERLRAALLDGQIQAGADEKELIRRLIDEGICDDNLS
jgi:tRNA nucleotidyltransferase (CCA-adding enzyme)